MTFGAGRDVVTRLGSRGVSPTLEAVPSPNLFAAISRLGMARGVGVCPRHFRSMGCRATRFSSTGASFSDFAGRGLAKYSSVSRCSACRDKAVGAPKLSAGCPPQDAWVLQSYS